MEEGQPGRPPGDSAREEERRRLLTAGHTRKPMHQVCEEAKQDQRDVGVCLITFTQSFAEKPTDKRVSFRKSEERKAPRKRTEQESARCKSPPLTTSPTFLVSAQEPFGQVPRGLGECTWPESQNWYHADCAPNPTVLPGSPSHCLWASASGSSPIPPVFPQVCLLQGVARHVLDTWAGVKDPLLQFARKFLMFHSSPGDSKSHCVNSMCVDVLC